MKDPREQTFGESLYRQSREDGLGAGSVNNERSPETSVTTFERSGNRQDKGGTA